MCDLFVGRVSVTLGDVRVSGLDFLGDRMHVRGRVEGTEDQVGHVAEQLRGLMLGADEQFVPVYWEPCTSASNTPGLTRMDGFYEVGDIDLGMGSLDWASLSLTLHRVQGFAAPMFESVIVGSQRAASPTDQVSGSAWHAVPATVDAYETGVLTPTTSTVTSETGGVSVFTDVTNHLYNARPSWYLRPRWWYRGAAEIRVDGQLVVGRQCRNVPEAWRISNGLVRITASGATLTTERWNSAAGAWQNPGAWRAGRKVSAMTDPLGAPHTITVLRNDPACVTVRCAYDAAALVLGSRFAVYVDYSLRRGSTVVEVTLSTRGAYDWGFQSPVTYAGAISTHDAWSDGVFIAAGTSEFGKLADGNGKTHVAGGPGVRQFDQWGWGYLYGQTHQRVAQLFAAAQSERTQVVAR